jgi:hypothetical protein
VVLMGETPMLRGTWRRCEQGFRAKQTQFEDGPSEG